MCGIMVSKEIRTILSNCGLVVGQDRVARLRKPNKNSTDTEFMAFVSEESIISCYDQSYSLSGLLGAELDDQWAVLSLSFDDGSTVFLQAGTFSDTQRSLIGLPSRASAAKSFKMPKTISELNDMFPLLFPEYKAKMYYDVMRERECVDPSLFDESLPEGRFTDLSEQIEYTYYDSLERRLKLFGCEGSPPNIQVRYMVLISKFYDTKRNRFKEWVQSITWDGEHRVDTWFQKIFNATAPPLASQGLEDLYLAKVSRAWFMGAIARMDYATVHEVVPVLVGAQGNGKTSGLRYTAGKPEWFIDTTADVSSAHGKMEFLDSVRGRIIVELAESTQIRTKDQEKLKAFISMKEDQYRKPYLRRDDTYPRHFIMAASSNLDDVFTDLTGNRRYYPVYCHRADLAQRTKYAVEQVWAEAYLMYMTGEQTYIAADWYPALVMQEFATSENSNVSIIEDWLDNPDNLGGRYTHIGATITRDEILYYIFGVTSALPGSAPDLAWKAWTKGTRNWVKMEYSIKSPLNRAKSTRAYRRVSTDGNSITSQVQSQYTEDALYQKCLDGANFSGEVPFMSDDGTTLADEYKGLPITDMFKKICRKNKITNEYSVFPTDGLNQKTITAMQDAGLIYYDRTKGTYRTVLLLNI